MPFEVWGLGCGVWCVGCGVWGAVCGVWGVGCGVWGVRCEVRGVGGGVSTELGSRCRVYRGTSLIRKRISLGPYRRPMPRVLGGFQGDGRFLMGEVTLRGGLRTWGLEVGARETVAGQTGQM